MRKFSNNRKKFNITMAVVGMIAVATVVAIVIIFNNLPHTHSFTTWEIVKEATCSQEGLLTRHCKDCDKIEEMTVGVVPHTPSGWITEVQPTCTREGVKIKKCTVCEIDLERQTIGKIPHTQGSWEIIKQPTIWEEGEKVRKCTVCGTELQTEPIEKLQTTESVAFNNLVSQIESLETLARNYLNEKNGSATADEISLLVARYIRSERYSGGTWNSTCGAVDADFVAFVEANQGDKNLVSLKTDTTRTLICPNTRESIDFVHMFANINGIFVDMAGGNATTTMQDLTGWAGDMVTLVADAKNYPAENQTVDYIKERFSANDSSFGREDVHSDLDAVNIVQIYKSMAEKSLSGAMVEYYKNLNEKSRRTEFYKTLIGAKNSLSKEEIVNNLYTRMKNNTYVSILASYSYRVSFSSYETLYKTCLTAFVEYLTENSII